MYGSIDHLCTFKNKNIILSSSRGANNQQQQQHPSETKLNFSCDPIIHLSKWCAQQKKDKSKLSAEKINQLNSLGFHWNCEGSEGTTSSSSDSSIASSKLLENDNKMTEAVTVTPPRTATSEATSAAERIYLKQDKEMTAQSSKTTTSQLLKLKLLDDNTSSFDETPVCEENSDDEDGKGAKTKSETIK